MLKDYYSILGITPLANQDDIKRAFRRLAKVYHPDSSDADTHSRFLDINEAYQTLGDPYRRSYYDQQRNGLAREPQPRQQPPQPPPPVDPEAQKRAYYEARQRRGMRQQAEFARYLPAVRFFLLLNILFVLSLALDYVLTRPSEPLTVLARSLQSRLMGELTGVVRTEDGTLKLTYQRMERIGQGDRMVIYRTPIYRIVRHVAVWHNPLMPGGQLAELYRQQTLSQPPDEVFYPRPGVFNVFIFAPLLLLLAAGSGLVLSARPEVAFKLALLALFVLPITLFFVVIS
ncbi:MAG: hypothetical protein OHK0039_29960 [Bacteroidia bacterium]